MKRDWLTLAFGLVLVGVVVGLSLRQNFVRQRSEVAAPPAAAPAGAHRPATPEPTPTPAGETPAPDANPTAATRPRPAPPLGSEPTSAKPLAAATLHVQSDIQGASVFLDRQFVGTTPLTLTDLPPGRKQLNVTATGHEGYAEAIDLSAGANRVNVEFFKVRLDAALRVTHRHAMGSCQGTLSATPKGLAYTTSNTEDAFTLSFADLEEFEVDYLKKNLKVRRRGGRTWNFTSDSADALLVFHRDVSKAREKLALGR